MAHICTHNMGPYNRIGEIGNNISTYRYEFFRVVSSGPFDEIVSRMTDIDEAIPQYVSIDES